MAFLMPEDNQAHIVFVEEFGHLGNMLQYNNNYNLIPYRGIHCLVSLSSVEAIALCFSLDQRVYP